MTALEDFDFSAIEVRMMAASLGDVGRAWEMMVNDTPPRWTKRIWRFLQLRYAKFKYDYNQTYFLEVVWGSDMGPSLTNPKTAVVVIRCGSIWLREAHPNGFIKYSAAYLATNTSVFAMVPPKQRAGVRVVQRPEPYHVTAKKMKDLNKLIQQSGRTRR